MTKDVEDIIRSKAYFELNSHELERVNEYAQNEEEYANMKWFLEESNTAFTSQKVVAHTNLKKGVMAHLTESKKKKGFWLNSVGIFLLPQGKPFYKKPGFQLGIAAAAVIGFLFVFNRFDDLNEDSLAIVLKVEEPIEEPIEEKISSDRNEPLDANQLFETERMVEDVATDTIIAQPSLREQLNETPETGRSLNINEQKNIGGADNISKIDADRAISAERMFDSRMDADMYETLDDEAEKEEVATLNKNAANRMKKDEIVSATDSSNTVVSVELSNKEVDMTFTTNASAPVIKEKAIYSDFALADTEMSTEERILPKKLHIDQTKELNHLFFIVK